MTTLRKTSPTFAVLFAVLCWLSAGLAVAALWAGSGGAAAIIAGGFAMSFAGLLGCAP